MSNTIQITLSQFVEEYQGIDGKSNLLADADGLYVKYKRFKCNNDENQLKEQITEYERIIDKFIDKNEQFYNRFIDKDEKEKDTAKHYIEHSQIHINKLQSQCNQLIYREQQCKHGGSMKIARIALTFTVIFSILSLLFSFFDVKYSNIRTTPEIEHLSDSISKPNGSIEQQNDVIKEHFEFLKRDTTSTSVNTNRDIQ